MARARGVQKGHLHKQGKMWYIAFREDDRNPDGSISRKRRNVRLGSTTELSKREARRIADADILGDVNKRAVQPASLVTVGEFVESRFIPNHVWALKASGKEHYKWALNKHVLPAMSNMRLRDVTSDFVQDLLKRKVEVDGLSVQSAKHIQNTISAVFNHAIAKGSHYGLNPTVGVVLPEMVRREAHAMSFQQAHALVKELPSPAAEMVLLSMTTSLNISELLGLRWKRVNLRDESTIAGGELIPVRTIAVRENNYRGQIGSLKAKSRRRNVPLSPVVVERLRALRERSAFQEADDLVFTNEGGRALDEKNLMRRVIKPIAERLGMPWVRWHVLRHTHATMADSVGMSFTDRQAQLGHSDTRMTMLYTHADLDRRRGAIEEIERRVLAGGI